MCISKKSKKEKTKKEKKVVYKLLDFLAIKRTSLNILFISSELSQLVWFRSLFGNGVQDKLICFRSCTSKISAVILKEFLFIRIDNITYMMLVRTLVNIEERFMPIK